VPGESALRAAERAALEAALDRHGGARRALAAELGISERTMYRKLAEFGLSKRP
jgi:DNA-binding NtrC family response regulator